MATRVAEEKDVAPWRARRFVWRTAGWIIGCWAVLLGGACALIAAGPQTSGPATTSSAFSYGPGVWSFAAMEIVILLVLLFCATWMVARTPATYQPGDNEPVKARKVA